MTETMSESDVPELRTAEMPSPLERKAVIEAERTGLAFVHWRSDGGTQELLIRAGDAERLTIGRRSDADTSRRAPAWASAASDRCSASSEVPAQPTSSAARASAAA